MILCYSLHFNISLTKISHCCKIDFLTFDIINLDFAENDCLGGLVSLCKPNNIFNGSQISS